MTKSNSNSGHSTRAALSLCPQTVDGGLDNGGLPELACEIRKRLTGSNMLLSQGIHSAWEAGKMLLEAKKLCPHGKWISWLEENVKLSTRQAHRYMRLAKRYPDLSKGTRASLLKSIRQSLTVQKPHDENGEDQGNEDQREEDRDDEDRDDEDQDDEDQDDEDQDDEDRDDEDQEDKDQEDENSPDLHRKRCSRLRRLTSGKRLSAADKQLIGAVGDAIGDLIPKIVKIAQGGATKLIKRRDADGESDQTLVAMLIVAQLQARLNPESAFAPVVVDAD